jgi:hypothetical protein
VGQVRAHTQSGLWGQMQKIQDCPSLTLGLMWMAVSVSCGCITSCPKLSHLRCLKTTCLSLLTFQLTSWVGLLVSAEVCQTLLAS